MKTLSIRPPWAWAMLHLGKRIENRTWDTRHRGPILIHAGKSVTADDYEYMIRHCSRMGMKPPAKADFLKGGIVARANLVDIVEKSRDPWFVKGCFGWVLEDLEPVDFFPVNGKLGLYETPWPVKAAA